MKQRLIYGNTYSAIEHTVRGDSEIIYLLRTVKKKKELAVSKREECQTIEEVVKEFEGVKHAYLIINTQQVLSRRVADINEDGVQVVRSAFPNILLDDFYFEIYTNKEHSFVSICRKEYVDGLLKKYEKLGVAILGISLGNLSVQHLTSFLEKDVYTSNAIVELKGGEIISIEKGNSSLENYILNNLEVSNRELLSFGGILSVLFNKSSHQKGLEKKNTTLLNEFNSKQFFTVGTKVGLGVLFVMLLVNFLVFSSYHSKNIRLQEYIQSNGAQKKLLLHLKKEVSQKERIVSGLESASQSNVSRYLDEIAEAIPNTLVLTELSYQPLKGQVKKEKEILIDKNSIVVKGKAKSNEDFINLVSDLKKNSWVRKITIVGYGKGKKSDSSFEFLIQTNDE